MPTAALPHAYPFRFVDTISEERDAGFSRGAVRVRIASDARAVMGATWGSPILYAEAIAQAALLLEGGDAESARSGFLAGIEGFTTERLPMAGETLDVSVRLAAKFGAIVRFDGEIASAGEVVARGSVLVRRGDAVAAKES
jgi:3-hydroxymyristoyl/3-hydroxydecanoyl-(acyl carrier protein) dehydratase